MTNLQDLFDRSVSGVIAQGRPARGTGGCKYRTDDGAKCAVGQLIDDKHYTFDMEGMRIDSKSLRADLIREALGLTEHDKKELGLLAALQSAHDNAAFLHVMDFLSVFKTFATAVADTFGLNKDVLA